MIKAIDTVYKGYRFRSRLEARWAVFFETCGFKWTYEPQGYEINGVRYLPDFQLYDVVRRFWDEEEKQKPFFVEVKGKMDKESRAKIDNFTRAFPIYVVGDIPFATSLDDYFDAIYDVWYDDPTFFSFGTIDGDEYPAALFVNNQGKPAITGPKHYYDFPHLNVLKTMQALRAARSKRFEWNEREAEL